MRYLNFDLSESGEGVTTLEAMATTGADHHAAVMAEVQQVLAWAERQFPHSHGPVDDGCDWQHELQVVVEPGAPSSEEGSTPRRTWTCVTLILSGSTRFVAEFLQRFGLPSD